VSGIAMGRKGAASFGVASEAGLLAVNVFSYFSDYDDVLSWHSDQLKGLEWVYQQRGRYRIAAVNMSLGGGWYSEACPGIYLEEAVANLAAVGIATVVSSGNDAACGAVSSPACLPQAIAVGGVNGVDGSYTWGNWDSELLDLLAPGVMIRSAGGEGDHDYKTRSGTSMAAPFVTGAFAVLRQAWPEKSLEELLALLRDNGVWLASDFCLEEGPVPRLAVGAALEDSFGLLPPLGLVVEQGENRSGLLRECINRLTWQPNPGNAGQTVVSWRIYRQEDSGVVFLAEVSGDTLQYLHRGVVFQQEVCYGVCPVTFGGQEGPPAWTILRF